MRKLRRTDMVVHFAADHPTSDASWSQASNTMDITFNVLLQAAKAKVQRVVLASSNHVMGETSISRAVLLSHSSSSSSYLYLSLSLSLSLSPSPLALSLSLSAPPSLPFWWSSRQRKNPGVVSNLKHFSTWMLRRWLGWGMFGFRNFNEILHPALCPVCGCVSVLFFRFSIDLFLRWLERGWRSWAVRGRHQCSVTGQDSGCRYSLGWREFHGGLDSVCRAEVCKRTTRTHPVQSLSWWVERMSSECCHPRSFLKAMTVCVHCLLKKKFRKCLHYKLKAPHERRDVFRTGNFPVSVYMWCKRCCVPPKKGGFGSTQHPLVVLFSMFSKLTESRTLFVERSDQCY